MMVYTSIYIISKAKLCSIYYICVYIEKKPLWAWILFWLLEKRDYLLLLRPAPYRKKTREKTRVF